MSDHPNRDSQSCTAPREPRVLGLLFCFLLALYLLTGKGFSDLQDAEGTYLVTESLVERGSVALPESGALTAGAVDRFHAHRGPDGRLYSQYWLGYPLFLVPWYLLGKGAGVVAAGVGGKAAVVGEFLPRVAVNLSLAFQTAALGMVLAALVLLLSRNLRLAVGTGLVYGLGTCAWPYAKAGFYEPFLGLCLLLCLYCLVCYALRRPHGVWLWAAGLVLGWGVATKPSLLLAAPGLLLYVLWRRLRPAPEQVGFRAPFWRELGLFGLGLLPWVVVVLAYNYARTGAWLNPGYSRGNYLPQLGAHHYWPQFYAYLLGPGRGMLIYCPVVLVGLWGWREGARRYPAELWAVLLISAAYLLYHPSRGPDIWAWGPRYLVPVVPLLLLPVAWGLLRLGRTRGGRVALGVVIAVSVLIQVVGIVVPYGTWLGEVYAETGTSQSAVLEWRYTPLLGQLRVLTEVQTTPLDVSAVREAGGLAGTGIKQAMRHSLDFWWFYAWRLGAPGGPLGTLVLLLLGAVTGAALALRRALQPPEDCATMPASCPESQEV